MRVTVGDQLYRVSWNHIPDAAKTQEFLRQNAPVVKVKEAYKGHIPLKPKNVIGMCRCEVLLQTEQFIDRDNPGLYVAVAAGYAFQHHTDRAYDKAVARKVSLRDALSELPPSVRQVFWMEYLKTWPPVGPEMGDWQRKYVRAMMENQQLMQLIRTLQDTLERRPTSVT